MIAQTQKNCLNVVGYMRRKKENNRNIVHEARRTLCLTLTIAGFIFICICGANALAATRQSTKQQTQNSAPLGNRVTTDNGEIRGVARFRTWPSLLGERTQ
jgi:hypothetical protein